MFVYLVALFNRSNDQGAQYHDQLVELYCSYQPDQLLHFLKLSKSYSYQKAYDLCKVRDMVPEMLFLLGKMGANREALNIIIERLEDVDLAIEFAKEKRDETLWDEFLNFSMDKPNFIAALLNNLGNYINPIRVIENIPPNLEIPGLQNAIIHTMADCSIQESLMDGCQKIFSLDIFNLMNTLVEKQQNGRAITPAQEKCSICNETIEDKESLLFFCSKHSYHSICLSPDQMLVTPSTPQSTSPSEFQKVMRKIDRIYNKSSNIFDTSASVKSNYLYLDPTYRFYCVKCLE